MLTHLIISFITIFIITVIVYKPYNKLFDWIYSPKPDDYYQKSDPQLPTALNIYEFRWTTDEGLEREWVSAHTYIEAIKLYCSVSELDLIEMDNEDEIIILDPSRWNTHFIIFPKEDKDYNLKILEPAQSFAQFMEHNTEPTYICGTVYF